MRKLTHQEILARQQKKMAEGRLPFCILLNNIRSLHNVGSIFRTADGAGAEKIWVCGITGYPPRLEIAKTALGAEKRIPWEYRKDAVTVLKELKNNGYKIVALEQARESIPYEDFIPESPVCLVVGHEISGVEDGLMPLCDAVLEIEMAGVKNSLNVAVAFGVVAYHLRSCLKKCKV